MRLKYGVVLLTSFIPRIAVTLFLQFVFVITNNKINAAAVTNHSIQYYIINSKFVTFGDPGRMETVRSIDWDNEFVE